jgi:hypothetical protein
LDNKNILPIPEWVSKEEEDLLKIYEII